MDSESCYGKDLDKLRAFILVVSCLDSIFSACFSRCYPEVRGEWCSAWIIWSRVKLTWNSSETALRWLMPQWTHDEMQYVAGRRASTSFHYTQGCGLDDCPKNMGRSQWCLSELNDPPHAHYQPMSCAISDLHAKAQRWSRADINKQGSDTSHASQRLESCPIRLSTLHFTSSLEVISSEVDPNRWPGWRFLWRSPAACHRFTAAMLLVSSMSAKHVIESRHVLKVVVL